MPVRLRSLFSLAACLFLALSAYPQGDGWDFGEGAIVLPDDAGVRFRVYAPGAETVAVAGDFNEWNSEANLLERDADGYYETIVPGARAGDAYKYVVNGTLWRKDPWSLQVEGSGDSANSIIADLNAYQWQSNDWQTPRIEEVVIYQLHLKGMLYNGDGETYEYGGVINDFIDTKLDYLSDLGVNCIHIMPVNEFPGEDSWGYNPVFYHAMESSYGNPEDFQRLVDECHQRDIAVIVGIVYNHTAGTDNTHYWDFDGTADNEYGGNGQFYYNDDRALTFWGPEPNYGLPRTRERFFDNVRMFAELYRVDGFRMDAVGFVRGESNDGNDWFGWQAGDGWQFLRDFNNLARSYHNGRFMSIAEDIASNPSITQDTGEGGAGFLAQWAETDLRYIMGSPDDGARNVGAIRRILEDYYPVNYGLHELVKYHSSHDKVGALNDGPRLPVLIGDPNAWYSRRRTMLANGLITFSPGAPLIFMGDEFYETRSFSEQVGQGLDWNALERNPGFYEFSRDIFRLKTSAPALHQNHLDITERNEGENLISWRRWGNNGEVIVFAANFSAFDKTLGMSFPSNGQWHQVINSTWTHYGEFDENNQWTFEVSNNWADVWLPGYSFVAMSTSPELPPGRVWNVTPIDQGLWAGANVTLDWGATSRAESYDVYMGTTEAAVAAASRDSPELLGNTTETSFQPGFVEPGETVFWRVDSINSLGTTTSRIFRFTVPDGDVAGTGRVFWTPAEPLAGDVVTVTYLANGGPLNGYEPLKAHTGFTIAGDPWQNTTDIPLDSSGQGSFQVEILIPGNAEFINLAFNHDGQVWDNNSGQDWTIPVKASQQDSPGNVLVVY